MNTNIFISNCLRKQRILIENAFGLIKGKIQRFNNPQQNGELIKYMQTLIASCVIHNIRIDQS